MSGRGMADGPNIHRREDSAAWARGISQRLVQEFGPDQVFMDVDSLIPGEDFVQVINRYVESVDVMLVIIGRHGEAGVESSETRVSAPEVMIDHAYA